MPGWLGSASIFRGFGGSVMRRVVAADLDNGTLALTLFGKISTTGSKTLMSTTTIRLHLWAKNHGA